MTAPAGVSSGSAPEPVARAAADPQAPGAEAAEPSLAAAVPPPAAEPVLTAAEPALAAAVPPQAATEPAPAAAVPPQAATESAPAAAVPPQAAEPAPTAAGPALAAAEPAPAVAEPAEEAGGEPAGRAGRGRGRRVLAVAATIVGILALVGAAVAVLDVATHGFRPKTEVTYREAAVFSLRPGECINSSPNGLSVTVRSCTTPHDAEVFATFRLTGSSWPGGAVIQQDASNGCMTRVTGYLNPQLATAGFTQEYVFPDQQAWQAGVRTVVCEIRAASGQLTGSVRQTG
jgi:putative regulator of septum formation